MTEVIPLRARQAAQDRLWYRINASKADEAELLIYNEIGRGFFGDGVAAEDLVKELAAIRAKVINVRINSNGGSVFEGLAIYNALIRHPARVVTHVDGIAASIASVLALAGAEVRIAKNAFMMIHNPHGMAMGNAADMRKMAETLETVGGSLLGIYRGRTGKSEAEVQAWMDAETWFNATDAKEAGFVDVVTKDQAVAASFDLSAFQHVPADVAALIAPVTSKPAATDAEILEIEAARHRLLEMAASIRK